MNPTHYSEVPRNEDPASLTEIKEVRTMIPLDLEKLHNRGQKLNYLTVKIKFFLPIIFILATFPFAIIMIILSLLRPVGDVSSTIGAIETISYISQSNPVVDIQPITGSQICSDSVFQPGQLGTWGGTQLGCYCPGVQMLAPGACTEDLLAECQNIEKTPSIETFTWNGDRFCMRRLQDFFRTFGDCPTGYTKCGNRFCTPTTEPCPVSDVKIIRNTDPTPAGYIERPMTIDMKLVFISESNTDVQFAQFSQSMGTPCIDMHSYAPRVNGQKFSLENQDFSGCGKYEFDTESVALNEIDEHDFYYFNFVTLKTDGLPGFNTNITGSTVTLSSRYRYETKEDDDTCAQFYISSVPEFVSDVEEFAALYRGITITGVILTTITAFIAFVYIKVIKRDGLWMINREEPFGSRFLVHIVCLTTLYAVTTAILGIVHSSKISGKAGYIKNLAGRDCFINQPKLNEAMSDMAGYLSKRIDALMPLNILLAIISVAVTGVMFANLLFRKSRRYDAKD